MLARAIAVLLFLAPIAAHAHGGGLDDLGCHHNRKAGGYHCHQGVLAGRSFASKAKAILALGDKLPPLRPGSTVRPGTPSPPDSIITARPYRLDDGRYLHPARPRPGHRHAGEAATVRARGRHLLRLRQAEPAKG